MPKYWVKNYFTRGRFPEVEQKQKTEKKEKKQKLVITMAKLSMAHASKHGARKPPGPKERKKRERAKVGDNNGQATHGARKHAWRTQAAWANLVKRFGQRLH